MPLWFSYESLVDLGSSTNLNQVGHDGIQVGEVGSSVHIKVELLFKVVAVIDFMNERADQLTDGTDLIIKRKRAKMWFLDIGPE